MVHRRESWGASTATIAPSEQPTVVPPGRGASTVLLIRHIGISGTPPGIVGRQQPDHNAFKEPVVHRRNRGRQRPAAGCKHLRWYTAGNRGARQPSASAVGNRRWYTAGIVGRPTPGAGCKHLRWYTAGNRGARQLLKSDRSISVVHRRESLRARQPILRCFDNISVVPPGIVGRVNRSS